VPSSSTTAGPGRRFGCGRAGVAVTLALALPLALGTGCASLDAQRIAREENVVLGSALDAGAWLFWPTSIRVHPLTRVQRSAEGEATIEVRIECRDATNEPTRAVGTIVVELVATGAVPERQRLRVDIASIADHKATYDPVTATYRLQFQPEFETPPAANARIAVDAYLFGADGAVLTATAQLLW
jgi:hypothetical protein